MMTPKKEYLVREDSFMKALFHGVIENDLIFPYPSMDDEEQETVSMILRAFVGSPQPRSIRSVSMKSTTCPTTPWPK